MLLGLRYQRCAAWWGLFAIWLQVAVFFPQVCPDDIAGLVGQPGLGSEIFSGASDAQDLPLCPLSERGGGDACIIYATVHLAGSTLLPEPINLDRTNGNGLSISGREGQLHLARARHFLFQTRAPPAI